MANKNFNDRKNLKSYSKIYRNSKNKRMFRFRNVRFFFILFFLVAAFAYLLCVIVYSFLNREHVEHVDVPKSCGENSVKNEIENENKEKLKMLNSFNINAVEIPEKLIFNESKFIQFLKKVKNSGSNAVVVVLKDEIGNILYESDVYEAKEWKTVSKDAVDAKNIVKLIKEEGLIPIAKISAFYDEKAPAAYRDNSFVYKKDEDVMFKFKDYETKKQKPFLNPATKLARRYVLKVVEEITDFGFNYVVVSNLAFPPFKPSVKLKGYYETEKDVVIKNFIENLKNVNNKIIVEYDFELLNNYEEDYSDANILFGGNIVDFGAKIQMPVIKNFKEFKNFKEYVLEQKYENVKFIPKLKFKNNIEEVKEYLKKEGINFSVEL